MYLKEFEVRRSDIDANRHLANSAYINFMAHTRMAFLWELGLGQKTLAQHQIGPVAFYEYMYYFKEIFSGRPIKVSMEIKWMSEDAQFFEFHHNFYDSKRKNFARCEMMGAWIDLKTRKLTGLTNEFLRKFSSVEKAKGFRVLTKADTRKFVKVPYDLNFQK